MALKQAGKWIGGLSVAAVVFLMVSFFVADRQLEPEFDSAELSPLDIPVGEPLPASAILFDQNSAGNYEVVVIGARESALETVQLTTDPGFDSWRPRLSPDRRTVLFYRTPVGVHDDDLSKASLWMVAASGGDPIEVLPVGAHGWVTQGLAEWSPSGAELVMTGRVRREAQEIWITSDDGRSTRRAAPESGDKFDPTWSVDGRRILYIACPETPCEQADHELYLLVEAGGDRIRLTLDEMQDRVPSFSPDGTQIVMHTYIDDTWKVRVMPLDRTTPAEVVVEDVPADAVPRWLDDNALVFHRSASEVDQGSDIYKLDLDQPADPNPSVLFSSAANDENPSPASY